MQSAKESRERVWHSNQAVREMRGAADRSLKKFKKLLTSARQCVTIQKLSLISGNRANEKKLKNFLTNARECDTIKSCWVQRRTGKNVKNFRKKFLTNGMKSCIIAMFRRKRRVPCKLNNVTKRKHQTERFPVRNHGGSGQEVAEYEAVNSSER